MAVILEDGTVVKVPPMTEKQRRALECPCDHDKTVDPLCCAAGMCAREDEDTYDKERSGGNDAA